MSKSVNFLSLASVANATARIYAARKRLLGLDTAMATAWEVLLTVLAHDYGAGLADIAEEVGLPESITRRWLLVLQDMGFVRAATVVDEVTYRVTPRAREAVSQIFGELAR